MKLRNLALSMAFLAGAVLSSQAMATQTVLTFADTSESVLFNFNFDTGAITLGPSAGNGDLTAIVGGQSFADTTFTLTDAGGGDLNFTTPGTALFGAEAFGVEAGILTIDSPANAAGIPLLQATFDSALFLSPFSVSASDVAFNNVTFSGEALNILGGEGATSENESFSFSLANFQFVLSEDEESIESFSAQLIFAPTAATATASFTSSADITASPVPVPAALPLMFSGLLGGLLFGRRKAVA